MRNNHITVIALTLSLLGLATGCGQRSGENFQVDAPKQNATRSATVRQEVIATVPTAEIPAENPEETETPESQEVPRSAEGPACETVDCPIPQDPLKAPTLLWATLSEDGNSVEVGFRDESTAETAFYVE